MNIWFNPSASIPKASQMARPVVQAFPWLNEEQIEWVKANAKTPKEQAELYKQVLPIAQKKSQEAERASQTNNLVYENNVTWNKNNWAVKITEFANELRSVAIWPIDIDDKELIGNVVSRIPNWQTLLADYMNGKSEEILYVAWIKERPIKPKSIEEWVTDAATMAWIWLWALAGTTVLGKSIKNVWDFAYNQAIKAISNQQDIVSEWDLLAEAKAWLWIQPKTIAETAMETKGTYGTPVSISAAAKKWMKEVREWTIAPVFDAIDNGGFKMWLSQLEEEVFSTIDSLKKIKNVQWYAEDLKAAVWEYFNEKIDKWISTRNLKQLQW